MKKRFLYLSKKFVQHELISGSFFVFFGGLLGNVFAFFYNLFLVRSLSFSDYAAYASLLSIIVLATLPSQSFLTIITQFATDYFSTGRKKNAAQLYIQATKIVLTIGILFLLFSFIFSGFVAHFLRIEGSIFVILIGVIISINYLGIVNTAFLQGLLYFKLLSFFTIVGSFFRLAIGVALIALGFKVYGALGALLIAYFVSFLLNIIPLRFLFSIKRSAITLPWKELLLYGAPTTLGVISLSSLTSTDIILVKHFFNPHDAGLYSGISLIGRVIFYFTAPIPSVMFPLVIKRFNKGENVHGLFYLSLALVFVASFAISLFYFIFPKFAITLFLGGKGYLKISPYLGLFGLNITLFSVVNVFSTFFLSLKKTIISYIVGAGAIMQIILISLFHKNFLEVITISIGISLLLLIALLIYYLSQYGKTKKAKETTDLPNYSGI